ncbi:hypothetical protein CRUP_021224 [Coryphaenoides rupestris]|nr:hypothetical protein CRUP_021224 [Coryphaenoides rupestris]
MLADFNKAQELLKDKIAALQILLQGTEEKLRNRESRPEDLAAIAELRAAVTEREALVKKLVDDKKFYQLELVNRETGFNKVFNSSANVGVINPLVKTEFRNCIVWLEDQKIRHYKIEERERQEALDWLLGLAVRYEYGDNVDKYRKCPTLSASSNNEKPADPLVNLDSSSPDFKAGVTALANILKVQRHDDYLVMLKAIRILIEERLSPEALAKSSQNKEVEPCLSLSPCLSLTLSLSHPVSL